MNEPHFLKMIQQLRQHEQIMLYGNLLSIAEDDAALVTNFLSNEYESESLQAPGPPIAFNAPAAMWAARTTYVASQLMLYREHQEKDLENLLPPYTGIQDASAMVSADLCLRFIPAMITHLSAIDSEDTLINILESIIKYWHYSGLFASSLTVDGLDFSVITAHAGLYLRYCERIVDQRRKNFSEHVAFNETIAAQLGMHQQELWKEFKRITIQA